MRITAFTFALLTIIFSEFAYADDLSLCLQGWAASESKQYNRALSLYDECIKSGDLTPSSLARTYRNYGIAYHGMENPALAIDFYNRAIALQPKDAWNDYVDRGNAFSELGKYDEALRDFDTAASLKPELADVHYNRGIVFERMNELDKAKDEFIKAYQKGLRSQQLYERFVVHGLINKNASLPNQ